MSTDQTTSIHLQLQQLQQQELLQQQTPSASPLAQEPETKERRLSNLFSRSRRRTSSSQQSLVSLNSISRAESLGGDTPLRRECWNPYPQCPWKIDNSERRLTSAGRACDDAMREGMRPAVTLFMQPELWPWKWALEVGLQLAAEESKGLYHPMVLA